MFPCTADAREDSAQRGATLPRWPRGDAPRAERVDQYRIDRDPHAIHQKLGPEMWRGEWRRARPSIAETGGTTAMVRRHDEELGDTGAVAHSGGPNERGVPSQRIG